MTDFLDSPELQTCVSCNKTANEVDVLFNFGNDSLVCDECIKQAMSVIVDRESSAEPALLESITPSAIKAALDEHVVGQERAKKLLSIAAYNHFKRISHKPRITKEGTDNIVIEKSNVLLVGPTGSGKTLFAKTLANILNVPFYITDATNKTAAGYVGEDVETIIAGLMEQAGGDIGRAQKGIVFIDEIDKISRKSENVSLTRDVSGEDVQTSLLKIIEGTTVEVAPGKRKHPSAQTIAIDTSNILFICGGSFAGIEQQITERDAQSSMGFRGEIKKREANRPFDYERIDTDALTKFGLIPELIGRLPIIAPLNALDREALRQILTEPKNALLKQYQALLAQDNIKLEFSPTIIEQFVDKALKKGVGARGLRGIVEEEMEDILFNAPDCELDTIIVGQTKLNNGKAA